VAKAFGRKRRDAGNVAGIGVVVVCTLRLHHDTGQSSPSCYRLEMPDGRIGHAELQIGSSPIMLTDEMLEMPDIVVKSPTTVGATTVGFNLSLEDVDARFAQAVAAGARIKRPVQNRFYGDRSGTVEAPFGHVWTLSTHVEDVTPDEIKRRMAAMPHSST
jgi:PhnB protein